MNAATRTHIRRSLRSAFTLAEMLVAVACLALLALGVAQVFSLTTRTVAAGRRLSNLNAVASATERQLRADFSAITREGVLVIRNEMADNRNPVLLSPDDQSPRQRRIDEVLFFAKSNFATARDPMRSDLVVKSQEAMIYLGHGLKQDPTLAMNQVMVSDTNAAAPKFNQPGPNRYAADWVLARRVVLLAPLAVYGRTASQQANFDSVAQIGMQPAAPGITRSGAAFTASISGLATLPPALSSGVVDIAVGDLQDVRRGLTYYSTMGSPWQTPVGGGGPGDYARFQQQGMMAQLLPADSDSAQRLRVESSPPNYLGVPWANTMTAGQQAAARADEVMLTSAAFLPRCTEFIVEYSFGKANPTSGPSAFIPPGATYWHGMYRQVGDPLETDRTKHNCADVIPFALYPGPWARPYQARDGTLFNAPAPLNEIHNLVEYAPSGASYQYAFFGQTDPYYSPMTVARPAGVTKPLVKDVNGNGEFDRQDGDILYAPQSCPWPWPTMVRITFSLADANDPTIEQTFQYVFTLPSDRPASAM